jgi:hypothetical protein
MWCSPKVPVESTVDQAREEASAAIRAFGPIGMEFNYLGRRCVVTGHSYLDVFPVRAMPALCFDYVDDVGVIHSRVSHVKELPALISQRDIGQ